MTHPTTSNLPVLTSSDRVSRPSRAGPWRRFAGYALSRGSSEAMLAIRGVLLALLLGPAAFGTWALLRLGMRYSALAAISVYRGLELELFQQRTGSGVDQRTSSAAALGFVLVLSGTIAALALSASLVVDGETTRLLLRGFAAASLTEAVYGYVLVCTRGRGNLRRYSMLEAGTSVLHVLWSVGLAAGWGLSGAFVGLTLANLMGIAAAARWVELRPALDWQLVHRMLQVGLPVVLTMGIGILLSTGDRWVVAVWGGPTMLGYYAFAGSVTAVAGVLAIVVRTVVFPQVYRQASSSGAAAALQVHLDRTLLPFACLVPPMLGGLSLAVGPLVAGSLPQYVEAVAPARIFLLSGAAMGLVNLASVGAVAVGRQRQLPAYATAALALTLGLSSLALLNGASLGGVASANFAGHLLFAALVLRLNVREAGLPEAERLVARVLLPLIWCTMSVGLSGALFPGTDLEMAGSSLLLYLVLLTPLVPIWRNQWHRLQSEPGYPTD
jgi:O-antigen/teichoic acid export membrane protein